MTGGEEGDGEGEGREGCSRGRMAKGRVVKGGDEGDAVRAPGCVAIQPGLGSPAADRSTTISQPWHRGLSTSLSSRSPAKHSSAVEAGSTELSIGDSSCAGAAAQPRGAVSAAAAMAVAAAGTAAAAAAAVGCAAARSAACLTRCASARARTV